MWALYALGIFLAAPFILALGVVLLLFLVGMAVGVLKFLNHDSLG